MPLRLGNANAEELAWEIIDDVKGHPAIERGGIRFRGSPSIECERRMQRITLIGYAIVLNS